MNGLQQNFWEENLPFGKILGSLFDGILLKRSVFDSALLSFLFSKNSIAGKKRSSSHIKEKPYNTYTRLTGNRFDKCSVSEQKTWIRFPDHLLRCLWPSCV